MTFVGIDPGAKGGMAVISEDKIEVLSFNERNYKNILQSLCGCDTFAYLEQVHSMPSQGVKSTFSFGENYGFIKGLLFANGINTVTITPQKWKKRLKLDKNKQHSINLAKKLYPNVNLKNSKRCRVDHDGIAEALLLAHLAKTDYESNELNILPF